MFRHSPSRNQRSKGIKVKQILQICVLLAVCFWLIYQVKHSHDKKKEFDKNDAKNSLNTRSDDEFLKFGRKDLHPQLEETTKKIDKHDEDEAEEEETVGEDEENKHEDEDKEEGNKIEEKEDGNKIEEEDEENKHEEEEEEKEGDKIEENEEDSKIEEREGGEREGAGDDDIDEHDQEKSDVEVDREERSIKEEEREEGDDKESEEKDVEDRDGIVEQESTLEDHDHDGSEGNTHEAREEQYKADDASSAVTHDTQTITSAENENVTTETSNEIAEVSMLETGNKANNTEEVNAGQNITTGSNEEVGEKADNDFSLNATVNEENATSSLRTEFVDNPELGNKSTEESLNFQELSLLQNRTETTPDSNRAQNATEEQDSSVEVSNNSTMAYTSNQSDSNSTNLITTENLGEKYPNFSTDSDSVVSEPITRSNSSTEVEDGSGSLITERSNVKGRADESTGPTKTEDTDEVQQHDSFESSDSSITQEEKEVRTDVDTLPEIRTEGSNTEYAAAE